MDKVSRVRQRTYYVKKRRGFCRKKGHINSEININNSLVNNVNNDQMTVMLLMLEQHQYDGFSAYYTSSMTVDLSSSSQKMKAIEASTPKEKEKNKWLLNN